MQHYKRLILLAALLLATAFAASQVPAIPRAAAAEAATCAAAFEFTVQQGPSAGLQVFGGLSLALDEAGSLTGLLTWNGEDGTAQEVQAVGQGNGRAINLLFDLGDEQYIFGAGTLQNPLAECEGVVGGPLVGPQPGDSGDWFGFFVPVPNPAVPPTCDNTCLNTCYRDGGTTIGCLSVCCR